MNPYMTIIIPAYGVEKYIEQCIQSVITGQENRHRDESIEVLIVDDGSPDRSGEIADEYAQKYSYIRVIHKQNAGVAAARNTGLSLAKGAWVYFMDSDDWLTTDAITILKKSAQENAEADVIVFDAWKNMGEEQQPWEHFGESCEWSTREEMNSLQRGMLYYPMDFPETKVPLAAPWDKLYRKSFLLENQLHFQENLKVLDDMVFNMEVFGRARKVCYYKDKIYHYRFVPDSITNSYKADRIGRDSEVWHYLEQYMSEQDWTEIEKEDYRQSYYCRVIKSFSICCRLCFFHKKNPKKLTQKLAYVRQILESKPYAEAFRNVDVKHVEWKLKVMTFMGRHRLSFGIYLLHVAFSCFFLH